MSHDLTAETNPISETLPDSALVDIPVLETGPSFALETLASHLDRAHDLLDLATERVPNFALKRLDEISRAWLERWDNVHLAEIEAVADRLDRPGCYFFSVNYEWGCTCRVGSAPDGQSARLVRVLDWKTPGLGRNILAAKVTSNAGPFTTLTWPGYTGVLSAMAPGRFSAALNQAPMRKTSGLFFLDWVLNRRRVWDMPHPTPGHLLRTVFETAADFKSAKHMLSHHPISTPALFVLAGLGADETAIIERKETEFQVFSGTGVAANHWQTAHWTGYPRGRDSAGRAARMHRVLLDLDPEFSWLRSPILNDRTRLVMIADAAQGSVLAQGFEASLPVTRVLDLRKP